MKMPANLRFERARVSMPQMRLTLLTLQTLFMRSKMRTASLIVGAVLVVPFALH